MFGHTSLLKPNSTPYFLTLAAPALHGLNACFCLGGAEEDKIYLSPDPVWTRLPRLPSLPFSRQQSGNVVHS